jgi:hypothetical protein
MAMGPGKLSGLSYPIFERLYRSKYRIWEQLTLYAALSHTELNVGIIST